MNSSFCVSKYVVIKAEMMCLHLKNIANCIHTMLCMQVLHHTFIFNYRRTAVFAGNTLQDPPRLLETADNIERYIQRDIRVMYRNTLKFS